MLVEKYSEVCTNLSPTKRDFCLENFVELIYESTLGQRKLLDLAAQCLDWLSGWISSYWSYHKVMQALAGLELQLTSLPCLTGYVPSP